MISDCISTESEMRLVKEIMSFSKEILEKRMKANSEEISYDEEMYENKLGIKTNNFTGTISRYDPSSRYGSFHYCCRFSVQGYPIVISECSDGTCSFYISDSDYGRVDDFDKKKIMDCFSIIHNDFWAMK